jgi:protein-S-isoprenylcysteine O-methyltransferase Ste14
VTPDMERAKRQLGDGQPINPEPRGAARPSQLIRWARHRTPSVDRAIRVSVNLAGAACAGWFAQASFEYFVQTHRLIGALFCVEQAWFVVAFLLRRPARAVSQRLSSWLLAAGGTFGGLLLRPAGAHALWAVRAGFVLQLAGLILVIGSLAALGRSFGFVAADRGVVTRGPYAAVRHPVYASYLLIQGGYVAQAASWRNLVVLIFAMTCNIGRIMAEERVLSGSPVYRAYRQRVRFRLLPGLW